MHGSGQGGMRSFELHLLESLDDLTLDQARELLRVKDAELSRTFRLQLYLFLGSTLAHKVPDLALREDRDVIF